MLLQLANVVYVLVAIAMIGLILMQRGSGAQAGSGFGGGASATVHSVFRTVESTSVNRPGNCLNISGRLPGPRSFQS